MLCAGSLFMAHFSFFVRLGNSFGFRSVVGEAFLGAVYRSHGLLTGPITRNVFKRRRLFVG